MYIVVLLIMLGTMALALGTEAFNNLVDIYSFVIIIGLPLTLLYISNLWIDFRRSIKIVFLKKNIYNEIELKKSLISVKAAQNYIIITGIFGTLLGIVSLFSVIDQYPEPLKPMSVALLTALYGVIIYIFLSPVKYKIEKLLIEEKDK